ncbi:hypothetical protein MNBD_GAMMA07-2124, partial [hydrothermal vent metagenome]
VIYAGGAFTSIGTNTRNRLAAIDTAGGATVWNPNANGLVNALTVDTSTVYVGGAFTALGGVTRNQVAAIGTDGVLGAWNPNSNGVVNALALNAGIIYVGGGFTSMGGITRNRLAAIDTAGVLITAWNPDAGANINTIGVDGTTATVYVGGDFVELGSSTITPTIRNRIAAIGTDGVIAAWDPNADLPVSTLLIDAGLVYVGGDFTSIGADLRPNHLAVIDASDGLSINWLPNNVHLTPKSLAIDGTTIYVGGITEFSNGFVTTDINGVVR